MPHYRTLLDDMSCAPYTSQTEVLTVGIAPAYATFTADDEDDDTQDVADATDSSTGLAAWSPMRLLSMMPNLSGGPTSPAAATAFDKALDFLALRTSNDKDAVTSRIIAGVILFYNTCNVCLASERDENHMSYTRA